MLLVANNQDIQLHFDMCMHKKVPMMGYFMCVGISAILWLTSWQIFTFSLILLMEIEGKKEQRKSLGVFYVKEILLTDHVQWRRWRSTSNVCSHSFYFYCGKMETKHRLDIFLFILFNKKCKTNHDAYFIGSNLS